MSAELALVVSALIASAWALRTESYLGTIVQCFIVYALAKFGFYIGGVIPDTPDRSILSNLGTTAGEGIVAVIVACVVYYLSSRYWPNTNVRKG